MPANDHWKGTKKNLLTSLIAAYSVLSQRPLCYPHDSILPSLGGILSMVSYQVNFRPG